MRSPDKTDSSKRGKRKCFLFLAFCEGEKGLERKKKGRNASALLSGQMKKEEALRVRTYFFFPGEKEGAWGKDRIWSSFSHSHCVRRGEGKGKRGAPLPPLLLFLHKGRKRGSWRRRGKKKKNRATLPTPLRTRIPIGGKKMKKGGDRDFRASRQSSRTRSHQKGKLEKIKGKIIDVSRKDSAAARAQSKRRKGGREEGGNDIFASCASDIWRNRERKVKFRVVGRQPLQQLPPRIAEGKDQRKSARINPKAAIFPVTRKPTSRPKGKENANRGGRKEKRKAALAECQNTIPERASSSQAVLESRKKGSSGKKRGRGEVNSAQSRKPAAFFPTAEQFILGKRENTSEERRP